MRKSIILFSLFTTILFLLVACQGSIYSKTAGMAFYTEASASSEACYCTAIYDPVCGVDGITYSNTCQAGCAGVTVAYEGECATKQLPDLVLTNVRARFVDPSVSPYFPPNSKVVEYTYTIKNIGNKDYRPGNKNEGPDGYLQLGHWNGTVPGLDSKKFFSKEWGLEATTPHYQQGVPSVIAAGQQVNVVFLDAMTDYYKEWIYVTKYKVDLTEPGRDLGNWLDTGNAPGMVTESNEQNNIYTASCENVFSSDPSACTIIAKCGDLIYQEGAHVGIPEGGLQCTGLLGIDLDAKNVVLDCGGKSIIGPGTSVSTGVLLVAPGSTVKNCKISNFGGGIRLLPNTEQEYLIENNVVQNNQFGISKGLSTEISNTRILGNTVCGNSQRDLHFPPELDGVLHGITGDNNQCTSVSELYKDDGQTVGCDLQCPAVCGNSIVEPPEACDIGSTSWNQWCQDCKGTDLQITKIGCYLSTDHKILPVIFVENLGGANIIGTSPRVGCKIGSTAVAINDYFGDGQLTIFKRTVGSGGSAEIVNWARNARTSRSYFSCEADWRIISGAEERQVPEFNEQNNKVSGFYLDPSDCKYTFMADPATWEVYRCVNTQCNRITN